MADSPSPLLQMRIQSVGANVNLWGGYINTDLNMLEQAAKGYQTLNVTGDATISWTNYVTGNIGSAARLRLTGALSAAAALTFPSFQNFLSVDNAAGHTVTIMCAGGTGVAIASGQKALLYCDGVDYFNAAPTRFPQGSDVVMGGALTIAGRLTVAGQIKGVSAATDGTDAPNLTQVSALIASAGIPGASGTVKVDAAANPMYLGAALTASNGLVWTDNGDTLDGSVDTTDLPEILAVIGALTATITTGTTAMDDRRRYRITGGTVTLPTMVAGSFSIVELAPAAGVTVTVGCNSQTIDGVAADDTYTGVGGIGPVVRYDYSSAGAVTSRLIEGSPV